MDLDTTRYYREKDGNILKLDIGYDQDSLNPRTDWDNVGTMVCFHRRYNLGDVHVLPEGKTDVIPRTNVRYDNSFDGAEAFVEWAKAELKKGTLVIASLELYDHGGITMHVRSWDENAFGTGRTGWDSCVVGWIFVTKERAFEEYGGVTEDNWREKAEEGLKEEVEIYDDYLTGSVYRYDLYRLDSYKVVENGTERVRFCTDPASWDFVDSCGGYYGHDHSKSGILECIPRDAVQIKEDELPEEAKEAA